MAQLNNADAEGKKHSQALTELHAKSSVCSSLARLRLELLLRDKAGSLAEFISSCTMASASLGLALSR